MSEERTIHNKQVRFLILLILDINQRQKNRPAGGWMRQGMLQRLLVAEGYELDLEEIHAFAVFLQGVGCLEIRKIGERPSYKHEYRITSTGMLVASQEKKIEGIGIWE